MFSHVYSVNKHTSKSSKNQTAEYILGGLVREKVAIKVTSLSPDHCTDF